VRYRVLNERYPMPSVRYMGLRVRYHGSSEVKSLVKLAGSVICHSQFFAHNNEDQHQKTHFSAKFLFLS
ncbi:hypothetical protein, partial [Bacillus sp. SJS]|uniref:hypothetical protein n=1 Tax=Bacillus sp. SJS TaxID=1423321 RepID=UPI001E525209